MVEVWRDPSVSRGENNFIRRKGLSVEEGVTDRKKQPPVVSGQGREGSARNKAVD